MKTIIESRKALLTKIGSTFSTEELRTLIPKAARKVSTKRTYDKLADPTTGGHALSFNATVVEPKSDILKNRDYLGKTVTLTGVYDARGPKGGRYYVGVIKIGSRTGRFKMSAAQIDKLFGVGAREARPIPMFALWDNTPRAKFIGWIENPR